MRRHVLSPGVAHKRNRLFMPLLFTGDTFDYEDHLSWSPLSGTLEVSLPPGSAGDSGLEEEKVPQIIFFFKEAEPFKILCILTCSILVTMSRHYCHVL